MKEYKIILNLCLVACLFSCSTYKQVEVTSTSETEIEVNEPTTPKETELYQPVPPTVNPTGQNGVPSDAIVLFDGTNFNEWQSVVDSTKVQWLLNGDGSMTVKNKSGNIQTKRNFGSIQLHVEWRSPKEVQGNGQGRGNSGVFLQKLYEVQVLDNNKNDTYVNGQVGSIYKQSIPLAKASVESGEWNAYDIIYHAPEFDNKGTKIKSATITVIHNSVLIQDHFEIKGSSEFIGWPKNNPHGKAPLMLQDHQDNSRVSYRNIWVRELD